MDLELKPREVGGWSPLAWGLQQLGLEKQPLWMEKRCPERRSSGSSGSCREGAGSCRDGAKVDVRETAQLAAYNIPVSFNKKPHQPHLENFFNAVRGKGTLNCPADEAFRSEYVIHKANESIASGKRIDIAPGENEA